MVIPRIWLRVLMGAILALSAGGCWDQVGIAERTLVIGLGIDLIPGARPILLTAQVVNFSSFRGDGGARTEMSQPGGAGKPSGTNPVIIETATGRSFHEAIHGFLKYSSRQLTLSHNRVVILGNELAAAGIAGILDDMMRNAEFRPNNWILVAKGSAKDALMSRTDLGVIPMLEMNRMLSNLRSQAWIMPVDYNEFLYQLNGEAGTGFAPMIQVEEPGPNPFPRLKVENVAVFKGDRLIGALNAEESQGLAWLTSGCKGGSLDFSGSIGGEPARCSVEITDGATRVTPRVIDGGIRMEIFCTGHGILRKLENHPLDLQTINRIEQRIEKALEGRVARTIAKAQLLGADFLGFARLIHATHPALWRRIARDWAKEFRTVETVVRFHINLVHYGNSRNPAFE